MEKTYGHYFEEFKDIRASLNFEKGVSLDKEALLKKLRAGIKSSNPFVLHLAGELHERVGHICTKRTIATLKVVTNHEVIP